ncbi:azoreductase [uncultured Clostridium sp.]|uniref:flavodoxin family protein n=1 Tax=uncultured Clostridium sp. TaxID=59620 RepID=UPI00082339E1|nr:NAD(P)H-dependent oxidoreductase [uncultured Clostridium sp.]SCK04757.1 azoreductase [uncultured Clostridium sp.]
MKCLVIHGSPRHGNSWDVLKIVEEADSLIITLPVYSMQLSGLLKNFIDHMSYNFHRPRFYNKKALIITTTAGAGHNDTAKYIKSVMYYWGMNYVMTLPVAYRSYDLKDNNKKKILKVAKSLVKSY